MSKKKPIKGYIFYTNDGFLFKTKPKKRRVVAINNNPNEMHVRRILSAGKGRNSQRGIPIGRYLDVPKESVVENRVIKKNPKGKKIKASLMRKSKTRLNKNDLEKLGIK